MVKDICSLILFENTGILLFNKMVSFSHLLKWWSFFPTDDELVYNLILKKLMYLI